MTLFDEIVELAKVKSVKVFFDMDGTCVEYRSGEKNDILTNKPGIYLNKRSIKTVLEIMKKLSEVQNVKVCILSNCYYDEQKREKIEWLHKFAPFIKDENIYIIVFKNEKFEREEKDFLKANKIKQIVGNDEAILIEDDHGIIKSSLKVGVRAEHISTLIE